MSRFAAAAKYSSLKLRIEAPRTLVVRFVCVEKVVSIRGVGILVTEMEEVELVVVRVVRSGRASEMVEVAWSSASWDMEGISMVRGGWVGMI